MRPHHCMFPHQSMRLLISPHPRQHLFSVFLILAVLEGVKWNLILVLICISPMANDTEHLFLPWVLLNQRRDLVRSPRLGLYFIGRCFQRMWSLPLGLGFPPRAVGLASCILFDIPECLGSRSPPSSVKQRHRALTQSESQ